MYSQLLVSANYLHQEKKECDVCVDTLATEVVLVCTLGVCVLGANCPWHSGAPGG